MGIQTRASEPADDKLRPRFEAAFDAHHIDVLAFACRRVDGRAAAEDVVAETFAVVWRKRDAIPDLPLVWLYAIARRVIANQRRSARRRRRLWERLSREPVSAPAISDPAKVVEAREDILAAFTSLSESEREVLMLVAWDGVDARAGAEILECTPAAFRMRLHRARSELQRHLEFSEYDQPTAATTSRTKPVEEAP